MRSHRPGNRVLFLLGTSLTLLIAAAADVQGAAPGMPSGGSVVSGSATISQTGANSTLINQTTKKALINWKDFSIPADGSVTFQQPGSSAITLNRVTGPTTSVINGNLFANGQVWLINGNGILFGKGAQVNVGGLIATTSDMRDSDFLSGNYNFGTPSANPDAAIVNDGSIRTAPGGSAVLSASRVQNQGVIQADLGKVVLAGANAFSVDFDGDNLLRYQITAPVAETPMGADGKPAPDLVSNSGTIAAQGGKVLLTSRAARSVVNNVINSTGIVEATSVSVVNGEIILDAGEGGIVNVAGTLDASGKNSGEKGGAVSVLADSVNIADGAKIDASGSAGGGTVNIGGDLHGAGPDPNALSVSVGKAEIAADAVSKGNGGTVAIYSAGDTAVAASLSAKGGAKSGDGGTVETSGHNLSVASDTKVDTSAPKGAAGTWLLDPLNINVQNGGGTTLTGGVLGIGTDPGTTDNIAPGTIITALSTTNVRLEASGSITVVDPVMYTSANQFSLLAEHNVIFNASVQNSGTGDILAVAGWDGHTLTNFSTTPGSFANGLTLVNIQPGAVGVAVGSKGGATKVFASNVNLFGGSPGAYAQIGYAGVGATGAIEVHAFSTNAPVTDTSVHNAGLPSCITATAGNICVLSSNSGAYAQIGHLGLVGGIGAASGAITVTATGHIVLDGGGIGFDSGHGGDFNYAIPTTSANAYAMIGNGDGATTNADTASGTISVIAGGNVFFDSSTTLTSRAWIGNRTSSGGNASGNVTLIAGRFRGTTGNSGNANSEFNFFSDLGNSSGTGGDVTLGETAPNDQSTGGVVIDTALPYNSPHTLTLLAAGPVWFQASLQNSGTGDINLIAGWNTSAVPAATVASTAAGSLPSLFTGTANSYGQNLGDVLIGGATSNSVAVGGAGGTTTLLARNLTLEADNGYAQLGFHGSGGSNLVADLSGDLTLTGGAGAGNNAQIGNGDVTGIDLNGPNGPNGTGTNNAIGDVTGDITLNVAGTTTFSSDVGLPWIGNVAGPGNIESGNVTFVTQFTNDDDSDVDVGAMIFSALGSTNRPGSGGDVTVAFASPNDHDSGDMVIDHDFIFDSPHALSIISGGGIEFDATLTNGGTGPITLISGWDPTVVTQAQVAATAAGDLVGLFNDSSSFGHDNGGDLSGGILIGGSNATCEGDCTPNVSVGSRDGTTFLLTNTLTVEADNGYAQLGYNTSINSGASGSILVYANGDVNLSVGGDGDCFQCFAQIGHGGLGTSGTNFGDIFIAASGGVTLAAGEDVDNYAQIGHGGTASSGSNNDDITVYAYNSDITLTAGDCSQCYAQIGHGGADTDSDNSGSITVQSFNAGVSLTAGGQDAAYAQIGHGGAVSSGSNFGNISVEAGEGDVTLSAGTGDEEFGCENCYAQIGHGGGEFFTDSGNAGDITVHADNGAVTLTAGQGFNCDNCYAQIGHGGAEGSFGTVSGNIDVKAEDDVTLTATDCDRCYAQIGHGGQGATIDGISGDISVTTNGNLYITGGEGFNAYAMIGHGDPTGNHFDGTGSNGNIGDVSGNITLLVTGNTYLDSNGTAPWIGNVAGSDSDESGKLTLITANDDGIGLNDLSDIIAAAIGANGNNTGGDVTIGLTSSDVTNYWSNALTYNNSNGFSILTAGSVEFDAAVQNSGSGPVTVVAGWNPNFIFPSDVASSVNDPDKGAGYLSGFFLANEGEDFFHRSFGNNGGGVTIASGEDGTAVGSSLGATSVLGASLSILADSNYAQLGYHGDASSDIIVDLSGVNVDGNTLEVKAGPDFQTGAYAQIGHGAANTDFDPTGDISVNVRSGDAELFAGNGVGAFAQIGHGGSGFIGDNSGEITVTVLAGSLTLSGGSDSYAYAQIGHGGAFSTGDNSGDINVFAGGDLTLNAGTDESTYAAIGHGGYSSSGSNSGDITVTALGNIGLFGQYVFGAYAQIGHGGALSSGSGSGDITVSAGGNLTLSGGSSDEETNIGNNYASIGNGDSADTNESVDNVSGDIVVTVGGTTHLTDHSADLGGGRPWIGNVRGSTGSTESGNVTLITGNLTASGDPDAPNNSGLTDTNNILSDFILADIQGGDVTLGFTAPGNDLLVDRALNYTSSHNLTIASASVIDIANSVQNSGTGAITVAAGWDPSVVTPNDIIDTPGSGLAELFTSTAGSYGIDAGHGGAVFVDGLNGVLSFNGISVNDGAGTAIGSKSGTTTILGKRVIVEAMNRYAQIGYHGSGGSGDIDIFATSTDAIVPISPEAPCGSPGNVCAMSGNASGAYAQIGDLGKGVNGTASSKITITATGNVVLSAGGPPGLGDGTTTNAYSLIGNGDVANTSDTVQTLSGDILIQAAGTTFIGSSTVPGSPAWIGNIGPLGSTQRGNVTLISGGFDSGDNHPDFGDIIKGDLGTGVSSGGDFTLAATNPSGSGDISGQGVLYDSPHTLSIFTAGSLDFNVSVQNSGSGAINIVTGWNTEAVTPGQVIGSIATNNGASGLLDLFLNAEDSYGQNGGSLTLGGHVGGVAVGSANGTTTVLADDVYIYGNNGYAQLGYNGDASGDIVVNALGDVELAGGAVSGDFAQIGHGGLGSFGDNSGDITVTAGGDVTLTGGTGQEAYAQIGHGGFGSSGSNSGDIDVEATGIVTLTGGSGDGEFGDNYAQIGHGGDLDFLLGHSSTGAITVTGASVSLQGGSGSVSYAQIGHGGYKSENDTSGTITVTANGEDGAVTLTGGTGQNAYAQIGHGGDSSSGDNSGDITITAGTINADGKVALQGGSGTNAQSYAQIGHGGILSSGDNSGDILVSATGEVTLAGGEAGNSYAQIGHGGDDRAGSENTGDVTVESGAKVELTGGSGQLAYAQIGNGGYGNGSSEVPASDSGDILVTADGDVTLTGGEGELAYAQIGHGGAVTVGDNSGTIEVDSGGGITLSAVTGGEAFASYAQIGHGGYLSGGNDTGDITVSGASLSLESSGSESATQIGNGGVASIGNASGTIAVTIDDSISLTASSTFSFAQIGNGGALSNPGTPSGVSDTGDITVSAASIDLEATGGSSKASIGNGGYGAAGGAQISSGSILFSGTISVTASDSLTLDAFASGSSVWIGNGGEQAAEDTILDEGSITYTGNVSVTVGTITNPGTLLIEALGGVSDAHIGNYGLLTASPASASGGIVESGTINVAVLGGTTHDGSATLDSTGTSSVVQVGNGDAGNHVGTASGAVTINVDGSFEAGANPDPGIAQVGNSGTQSSGTVVVAATGDVTLDAGALITSNATGDAIVVATGGDFTNGANAGVFNAPNGRWLVFMHDPGNNTPGGLSASPFYDRAFNFSTDGYTQVTSQGNRFVYAIAPVLTVSADNKSKTYGDANPELTYSITGLQGTDELVGAVSGTPTLNTAAVTGSNAGDYAITVGQGSLASDYNYGFQLSNGNLHIDPATLTYTSTAASRTYGAANPAFSGTVSGFVNGDTQSSATSGTLAFTSPATASSNVGLYAINGSGLSANNGNYVFVQAGSNATALTINPATLAYAATAASRIYGASNPTFTGTVTGFVNGDTQGSATSGTLTFTSPATGSSNVGHYAINGSGLTANNGNYTFTQAGGNAAALTINPATLTYNATAASRTYGTSNPAFTGTVTGFVNGENQQSATTGTLAFASQATSSSNVGHYAINGSGLTANSGNYTFAQAAANATALTINPATLTAGLTGTVSKVSDGTTDATLAPENYTLSGVVGEDNVSLNDPVNGHYDTPDAGTGKIVTVSGLALSGEAVGNYTLLSTSVSGPIGEITQSTGPDLGIGGAITVLIQPLPVNPIVTFLIIPPPEPPAEPPANMGAQGTIEDSEEPQQSDAVADSVGGSLSGTPGSVPSNLVTLIGGLLQQYTPPPGAGAPHGVPPADQDFSSWGNEAFWQ